MYRTNHQVKHSYKNDVTKKNENLTLFKESIGRISVEYCAESSISGLKHVVDRTIPRFERLMWIVVLIMGFICSASLVWNTFQKYYGAPLVTTQMPEGISVSTIIFPAVGICTNNRISKRAVERLAEHLLQEERNKKYSNVEMITMLHGLGQLYDLQPRNNSIMEPEKLHHVLGNYNALELMQNLTPRCEDIMVKCAWNDMLYNCTDLFDFRLTENGYCCTFNYLRESDIIFQDDKTGSRNIDMYKYGNKSVFDYDQGLKVLLRLNESDDFYYNRPLQGATLQFSDAYDFPDAPSGSFSLQIINPGVHMTVEVLASIVEASRDIQHIPLGLRKCLFYDESPYLPFYTHSDCMLKCRMLFLLQNCNCTPFTMPKMKGTRTCSMIDISCLRIFYAQSITARPDIENIPKELELDMVGGGISCPMCYPTCSKTAYSYDSNNVYIYPEYLNSIMNEDRDDWLREADFTGTSILHVKYAREVADSFGQNVIMKWFDLFSNIGSTCGFVTGFSFISILELIYFFTVKLFRNIKERRLQERTTTNSLQPTSVGQLNQLLKCSPLYWNELMGSIPFNRNTID